MPDYMPPDLASRQRALKRREAVRNAMMLQAMTPQQVPQGGRIAVRQSPLAPLAQMLSGYAARKMGEQADAEQAKIDTDYAAGRQAEIARVMAAQQAAPKDGLGGRKAVANAMVASQYPDLQALGAKELLAAPGAITQVKLGDRVVLMQDGAQIGELPVAASPDAQLREGGAMARHQTPSGSAQLSYQGAMQRHGTPSGSALAQIGAANARHATPSGSAMMGRIPAGYEQTEDGLRPVVGGPYDPATVGAMEGAKLGARNAAELQANAPKVAQQAALAVGGANSTIDEIDKALAQVGFLTSGLVGKASSVIPQTPAYELAKTAETIRANIGFDRLQAMRDASPTGGALGQVAVQELTALQNSIASLDQGLSPDKLRENLSKVRTHYENWKKTVQQGQPATVDMGAQPSMAPTGGAQFLGFE